MRPDGGRELQRVRGLGGQLREVAQDLLDGADGVFDVAGQDRPRIDRPELQRCDDAEVAAATAQRPEEVRIAIGPATTFSPAAVMTRVEQSPPEGRGRSTTNLPRALLERGPERATARHSVTLCHAPILAVVPRPNPNITRPTYDPSARPNPAVSEPAATEERSQRARSSPTIQDPADLRGLIEPQSPSWRSSSARPSSATVATTGGHLGSSLGVVEVTIAFHRSGVAPRRSCGYGHQAYPHKLLTGRLERFGTLRQLDGIGGFPVAPIRARRSRRRPCRDRACPSPQGLAGRATCATASSAIAVVVGDAALMSGLSLEALNDIGQRQTQILIVVNDNEMSISPTVGAFSKYLSEISCPGWQQSKTPTTGRRADPDGRRPVLELSQRLRASVVRLRPAGPALRGSRDHLHRRGARVTNSTPSS